MIGWVRVRLKRTVLLADVWTNYTGVIFRVTEKVSVASRWCYKSGPSKLTGPLSRALRFMLLRSLQSLSKVIVSTRLFIQFFISTLTLSIHLSEAYGLYSHCVMIKSLEFSTEQEYNFGEFVVLM